CTAVGGPLPACRQALSSVQPANDNLSFLFQAEDGIRDRNVTGVQTCALPIWIAGAHFYLNAEEYTVTANDNGNCLHSGLHGFDQIGRASCREGGQTSRATES